MKIQKNNQINSLLYSGRNIINGNKQKNNKSPLLPNTQIAAYKVDANIKSDTIKDKLMRKRTQLLSEISETSKKDSIEESIKSANVHYTVFLKDPDNKDLISDDDLSALMEMLEKYQENNKGGSNENIVEGTDINDRTLKNVVNYLNSTDKPVIDVTNNDEKTGKDLVTVQSFFFGKPVLYRYDKSLSKDTPEENKKYFLNGINITPLERLEDKADSESKIIGSINNAFYAISKNLTNFRKGESAGRNGFGDAASAMCHVMYFIADHINKYNEKFHDTSFFDNVIGALEKAKKSLFTDSNVENDKEKASVVSRTKLIDYITDLVKKGRNGERLNTGDSSEPNYKDSWNDMSNILASEFGMDKGKSLADVKDGTIDEIIWKYQQYKKKFMESINENYKKMTNLFQYKNNELNR